MNSNKNSSIKTGKEPVTQAYLDLLFNKPVGNQLDNSELLEKKEINTKKELTQLDTKIEATNHKVNYLRDQLNYKDFDKFQEQKKLERAQRLAQKADDTLNQDRLDIFSLNIQDNLQETLITIMSENKKLKMELQKQKQETVSKCKIIEQLRDELRVYKQREVLYQDEIINIKVEEQIKNQKSSLQNQLQKNQPINNNISDLNSINSYVRDNNSNKYNTNNNINKYQNNNDDGDFWGNDDNSSGLERQNQKINQQENLNNILGQNNNYQQQQQAQYQGIKNNQQQSQSYGGYGGY